jgi:hypothetical protein
VLLLQKITQAHADGYFPAAGQRPGSLPMPAPRKMFVSGACDACIAMTNGTTALAAIPRLVSLRLSMPEQGDTIKVASGLHHATFDPPLADLPRRTQRPCTGRAASDALRLTGLQNLNVALRPTAALDLPRLFAHLSAMRQLTNLAVGAVDGFCAREQAWHQAAATRYQACLQLQVSVARNWPCMSAPPLSRATRPC